MAEKSFFYEKHGYSNAGRPEKQRLLDQKTYRFNPRGRERRNSAEQPLVTRSCWQVRSV